MLVVIPGARMLAVSCSVLLVWSAMIYVAYFLSEIEATGVVVFFLFGLATKMGKLLTFLNDEL